MTVITSCPDGRQIRIPGSRVPPLDLVNQICAEAARQGIQDADLTDPAIRGIFGDIGGTLFGPIGGAIGRGIDTFIPIGGGDDDLPVEPSPQRPRGPQPALPGFGPRGGANCIPPFRRDPITGDCKIFLGEQPGPDIPAPPSNGAGGFQSVNGLFGPGVMPAVVGSRTRQDGSVAPIRQCPTGFVLGTDEVCYDKPARWAHRKHRPGPKPLLSPGEVSAISKAASAAGRVKKNNSKLRKLGLLPTKKAREKTVRVCGLCEMPMSRCKCKGG